MDSALEAYREYCIKFYWVASIVILFYDYFITLDVEINNLWGRRPTVAQCLFYVNRYVPLATYGIILAFMFNTSISASACHKFLIFPPVAMYLSDAVMGAIVIIRTSALYAGKRHILAVMLIVYVAQLVFGGVVTAAATRSPKWRGHLGCITPYPEIYSSFLAFLWPTACLFDFMVLYLTLHRTLAMRKQGTNAHLVSTIHRDGVHFFAVMFFAKLINLIIFFTAPKDFININWVFNNTICIIMINRLVLNIRKEVARIEQQSQVHHVNEKDDAALDDEKPAFFTVTDSRRNVVSTIRGGFAPSEIPEFDVEVGDAGKWSAFESRTETQTYMEPFHFDRSPGAV